MKFEGKFGVGEVVYVGTAAQAKGGADQVGEIISVIFSKNSTCYLIDLATSSGMQRMTFDEWQILGDPDFDQELGSYKE